MTFHKKRSPEKQQKEIIKSIKDCIKHTTLLTTIKERILWDIVLIMYRCVELNEKKFSIYIFIFFLINCARILRENEQKILLSMLLGRNFSINFHCTWKIIVSNNFIHSNHTQENLNLTYLTFMNLKIERNYQQLKISFMDLIYTPSIPFLKSWNAEARLFLPFAHSPLKTLDI